MNEESSVQELMKELSKLSINADLKTLVGSITKGKLLPEARGYLLTSMHWPCFRELQSFAHLSYTITEESYVS